MNICSLCIYFTGGWVGYFSYDTVRYAERKKLPFVGAPFDDRKLPDMHLGLYTDVIVFDHVEKVIPFSCLYYCCHYNILKTQRNVTCSNFYY